MQLAPTTTVQMANRPTGVDEAIKFIWNQPDTVLQSSEKQRLSAALAKETDVVARRYFLAPLPEQWVGTLKELLAPTGIFAVGMCANSTLAVCFTRVHNDPAKHSQQVDAA